MTIRVNVQAIKEKLERMKEDEEIRKKRLDPSESPFVKVKQKGKLLFRAIPYPYNEDPESDPFVERAYHYGIPGQRVFYCPAKNDNEKCHICDFVWNQLRENKGNKDAINAWKQYLPKFNLFVVGKIRSRENEGPKFLKITHRRNQLTDKVQSLYEFFTEPETESWMDPERGIDIKLEFEETEKFGLILTRGKLQLDRKETPFGKKGEYEEFLKSVKNIDEDVPGYERKTSEDSLELLEQWAKRLGEKIDILNSNNSNEMIFEGEDDDLEFPPKDSDFPLETEPKDLRAKLRELGIE